MLLVDQVNMALVYHRALTGLQHGPGWGCVGVGANCFVIYTVALLL